MSGGGTYARRHLARRHACLDEAHSDEQGEVGPKRAADANTSTTEYSANDSFLVTTHHTVLLLARGRV